LYELARYQEACSCFAEVVALQPRNKIAWNNQGYLTLVEYSYGSQIIFDKPLLIHQVQVSSSFEVSNRISLEDCQKAMQFFDAALNVDPDFLLAWANRSFPAYHLQQYQVALQNCNRALELDPDNEQAMHEVIYNNRGCVLLELHNPSAALQSFIVALSIAPTLNEAWLGKGNALYQLGRYTEAIESFMQALRFNHPLAQAHLDQTQAHLQEQTSH
ncbi:MAG: tetratricopeptide repeat protein, partial [Cyanobacteria bacterium P01_F01_bin.86]